MLKAALDTSSGISFAVIDSESNEVLIDLRENLRHGALSLLADMVKDALREKSINIADIKAWSVGTGPGSFTGIRIGIGFVKAVCMACNSNYRGISTSYALASSIDDTSATVAVVYDGRKKELLYDKFIKDGTKVTRLSEARVLGEAEINEELATCDTIVTLHEKPVTLLLNEKNLKKLCAFETLNSSPLCRAKTNFLPSTREEMEESCHPVYVRPAVFVEPKQIREVK